MIKVSRYDIAGKLTHQAEVISIEAAHKFLDRVSQRLATGETGFNPPLPDAPREAFKGAKVARAKASTAGIKAMARNRRTA